MALHGYAFADKGTRVTRAKPTMLLVEDDELLRSTLAHHLDADFEIISIGTGEEAIKVIGDLPKIDLLLTDFDLRGNFDGLDVARAMRVRDPQAPILLVTGSGANLPRVKELLAMPSTAIVEKPFQIDRLDQAVCSLLPRGKDLGHDEETRQV